MRSAVQIVSLFSYGKEQATLPSRTNPDRLDIVVMNDSAREGYIADTNELAPIWHNDVLVADLMAFMHSLTDSSSINLRGDVPDRLPSGLPLAN